MTNRFRILTWNICFEPSHIQQRTKALVDVILNTLPDLVALQEVTPETFQALSILFGEDYDVSPSPPNASYFTATWTRREIGWNVAYERIPFETTRMERDLLVAKLRDNKTGERKLVVGNVHLESLDSQAIRRAQMKQIVRVLEGKGDVVIVGDFNMDDRTNFPNVPRRNGGRIDGDDIPDVFRGYVDAWMSLYPESPGSERTGATFVAATQKWKGSRGGNLMARYDRCMARLGETMELRDVKIWGNEPFGESRTGDPVYVSDHWGLMCELRTLREKQGGAGAATVPCIDLTLSDDDDVDTSAAGRKE